MEKIVFDLVKEKIFFFEFLFIFSFKISNSQNVLSNIKKRNFGISP